MFSVKLEFEWEFMMHFRLYFDRNRFSFFRMEGDSVSGMDMRTLWCIAFFSHGIHGMRVGNYIRAELDPPNRKLAVHTCNIRLPTDTGSGRKRSR